MRFRPPRLTGLLLGLLFLAITAGAAAFGVVQFGSAGFSPWLAIWVALPLLGMPAALVVAYRLFGLLTASYQVDRDGIRVRWGLAVEQVPLADVLEIRTPDSQSAGLRPGSGIWWPGCLVGRRTVGDLGLVEFFASSSAAGMLLLRLEDRWLAISPSDREGFHQAYVDMMRMGSLERIPAIRLRPDFLFTRVWSDRWARALVFAGLGVSLLLLGYLAYRASALTTQVPFGFDPYGEPEGFVSPTQLLLLPMLAGLCWGIDFVLGLWLYRRDEQRPLAYGLWAIAVLVGSLLWGASLQLLANAR